MEENTNLFNISPFNAQLHCEILEDEVISKPGIEAAILRQSSKRL